MSASTVRGEVQKYRFTTAIFLILGILAIITAVAFSGLLGTSFALTWFIAIIAGAFLAYFLTTTFRDWILLITVGILVLFTGIALMVGNLVPDLGLILLVTGFFTIALSFARIERSNVRSRQPQQPQQPQRKVGRPATQNIVSTMTKRIRR